MRGQVGGASSMESCNLPVGVVGLDNQEVVSSLEDSMFRVASKENQKKKVVLNL